MARLPRYVAPGIPQHVIQHGNNRQAIFADAADYRVYRDGLKESASRHGLRIQAYVLMTHHVHLLVSPEAPESMSRTLQSLGRRYVQYFNWTYGRTGTLWEGRYRATVVDAEPGRLGSAGGAQHSNGTPNGMASGVCMGQRCAFAQPSERGLPHDVPQRLHQHLGFGRRLTFGGTGGGVWDQWGRTRLVSPLA